MHIPSDKPNVLPPGFLPESLFGIFELLLRYYWPVGYTVLGSSLASFAAYVHRAKLIKTTLPV